MNKPDGFTYLRMADLPGVSTGIETRLAAGGIRDITALWNIGAKHARALWGNVEGERLRNALHGHHVERPETKKRMFGHSRMLPMDWRTPEKVGDRARQLTMGAGRRLRRADFQATKLSLSVRGGGYRSERSSKKDDKRWNCGSRFCLPVTISHCFALLQ